MAKKSLCRGAWALSVCLLCAGVFTGCRSEKEEKKVQETPVPTEKPLETPEDRSSNLGAWTRAMGSVLIELNEGDAYVFGGYEKNEDNRTGAVQILKSSWNIQSKQSLLKQIRRLLKTGDRVAYRKEAKEMNALSKKKLKTAMKQLSGELLYHYENVAYNWKTWGKRGLLAWDMCRIAHLAQWGYIADYLTLEEAQGVMEPAVKKCRKNFSSWDEVQNNWLDGYCLFASIDRDAPNTDYTVRKKLYGELKKEQRADRKLYDDDLFRQEIKPLAGYTYQSIIRGALP